MSPAFFMFLMKLMAWECLKWCGCICLSPTWVIPAASPTLRTIWNTLCLVLKNTLSSGSSSLCCMYSFNSCISLGCSVYLSWCGLGLNTNLPNGVIPMRFLFFSMFQTIWLFSKSMSITRILITSDTLLPVRYSVIMSSLSLGLVAWLSIVWTSSCVRYPLRSVIGVENPVAIMFVPRLKDLYFSVELLNWGWLGLEFCPLRLY